MNKIEEVLKSLNHMNQVHEQFRVIENQMRVIEPILPALQQVQKIAPYFSIFQKSQEVTRHIKQLSTQIPFPLQNLVSFSHVIAIAAQQMQFSRIHAAARQWEYYLQTQPKPEQFLGTYFATISNLISSMVLIQEISDLEDYLESLERFVDESVTQLPEGSIWSANFRKFQISLFFFILMCLVTMNSKNQILTEIENSHQILIDRIEQSEKRILKKINEKNQKCDNLQSSLDFPKVIKETEVRESPSLEAEVLQIISPEQIVSIEKYQKQWVFIEFFDYVKSEIRLGWVLSSELKPLSNSPEDSNPEELESNRLK